MNQNPYAPSLVTPQKPLSTRPDGITRAFPLLTIARQLEVPVWDKLAAELAVAFWRRRGFENVELQPGLSIVGTRGSWLGNFTAYNISRLRTWLEIQPLGSDCIHVELVINTFGQQITEWNRAYWRLELIDLQRRLRGEEDILPLWEQFRAGDR